MSIAKLIFELKGMKQAITTTLMHLNENEKQSARKQLRRLRIALIVWVIVFLIAIAWFMITN